MTRGRCAVSWGVVGLLERSAPATSAQEPGLHTYSSVTPASGDRGRGQLVARGADTPGTSDPWITAQLRAGWKFIATLLRLLAD